MKTEQTKIEFGFGVELTRDGNIISETTVETGLAYVRRAVLSHFDGCTFTAGAGSWRNPSGDVVTERCYTLTVLADKPADEARTLAILAIAEAIKFIFTQEAVAVTLTPVSFSIL